MKQGSVTGAWSVWSLVAKLGLDPFQLPSWTPKGRKGSALFRRRWEQQWRSQDPARQWGWNNREPGPDGRTSSPSNLHTWGIAETPACPLCSKQETLEHILSCCTRALGDGRYRWRHDQVLKNIAEAVSAGLVWAKQFRPSKRSIAFVWAGAQSTPARRAPAGILTSVKDWQLLVDLKRQLKFPSHIAATTFWPDIIRIHQSNCAIGADRSVGRPPGRSLRKKALQVCRTG